MTKTNKTVSDKQRSKVKAQLAAKRAKLAKLEERRAKAVEAANKAQVRSFKLAAQCSEAQRDIDALRDRVKWHDETCHACGCCLAWELGEDLGRFVAYSPDGSREIGYRCGDCQKVARAVCPPSVYGERWRAYVAHDELAPKVGA